MTIAERLIAELEHEAIGTRKVLGRIPPTEFGWKPHEKSMSMGALASHLAETPGWIGMILSTDEKSFNKGDYKPWLAASQEELLAKFEESLKGGIEALKGVPDEKMHETWTLKMDGKALFSQPKVGVVQGMVIKHGIHHRAQLTVYLRLRDIPVPSVYGPSADEAVG